jgi:carboxymethylenebutenolidase
MSQTIDIQTEGGEFSCYVARPISTTAPVVIVLHEIFGVNDDIRLTCSELANAGFLTIAPELFWRQERGVDLSSWSDAEWKKGLALYGDYDRDVGVRDIIATVRAGEQLQGASGKVGVMGFCLGGLMTYLTAARHNIDAAVAYHGGDTESYLGEARGITAPLLMHLAEEDEFISKDAQSRIKAALADVPSATIHSYPGCNHAFARHTGLHYDAKAAALANGRTQAFLARHLGLAGAS